MKQRSVQMLFAYWNEVRAGRLAPHRLEIEPSRIAPILPETFMLERVDATTHAFRLAGTRLCELFGSELRGRNFLDGFDALDRSALQRQLTELYEQGAVVLLTLEGGVDARHRLELEALLLPLVHAGNRVARIIGAMGATVAPYWLENRPLRRCHLLRHELIWPDGLPHGAGKPGHEAQPRPAVVHRLGDHRRFRVFEGGRSSGKPRK
jgi:hypothetical protein